MNHELKTIPRYYEDVRSGKKNFEVRFNDRNFQIGDELTLREWDPEKQQYTGRWHVDEVIYILDDPQFVKEGYVILGMS